MARRLLILLIGLSLGVRAQTPGLDLEQARQEALKTSAVLKQYQSRTREARYSVDEAYTQIYPTLSLNNGYLRQDPPVTLTEGKAAIPVTVTDNFNTELGLKVALYTFGRLKWSAANAELTEKSRQAELEREEARVVEEVTTAYYDSLLTREQVQIATDNLTAREAHLRDAHNLMKSGVAARFDVLRDEAAYTSAQNSLLEANVLADTTLTRLFSLVGRPFKPGQEAILTPVPPSTLPPPSDLQRARQQANDWRPDLAAMRWAAEAGRARVELAWAQDAPTLNFQSDYLVRTATALSPGTLWTLGVNLNIPLFDGGLTDARTNQAKETVVQLEALLEDAQRQVQLDVDSLFLELSSRWDRVKVTAKTLESAREAARVARLRYEAGISSNVELLDAEAELTTARLQDAESHFQYLSSWARWERAVPQESKP